MDHHIKCDGCGQLVNEGEEFDVQVLGMTLCQDCYDGHIEEVQMAEERAMWAEVEAESVKQ